jgi:integrase
MINRQNKLLVDEYLAYRLRFDQLDPKSVRLERSLALHYLTWAGEQLFKNAPKFEVSLVEYVRSCKGPDGEVLSQHYRRKIIGSARTFFTWLTIQKQGFRSITPAWLSTLKIRLIQEEFDDETSVSLDEILRIARTPVKSLVEERVRAGTVFLYLSGMRISAFVSMPLKALDLNGFEIRQSPELGVRTKNKKSAVTYLIQFSELFDVVKAWDKKVRAVLPPEGFWFAPISSMTGEIDPTILSIGEHRSAAFHKNLVEWLAVYGIQYHSPHDFRRGHANYLFDNAKDMNDLEAVRENLMHESLTTTERYARQRRSQRKTRILQMSSEQASVPQNNLQVEILNKLNSLTQTIEMLRSQ